MLIAADPPSSSATEDFRHYQWSVWTRFSVAQLDGGRQYRDTDITRPLSFLHATPPGIMRYPLISEAPRHTAVRWPAPSSLSLLSSTCRVTRVGG